MAVAKDSKTARNLAAAFAGESQARNRYTCFAAVARSEGHAILSAIFEDTANNEREHARLWLAALEGIGTTAANLAAAAAGEQDEWTSKYQRFAQEAAAEGYAEVARQFKQVADIEKRHEERFRKFMASLDRKAGPNPTRTGPVKKAPRWECRACGHSAEGPAAPAICPTCLQKDAFFRTDA